MTRVAAVALERPKLEVGVVKQLRSDARSRHARVEHRVYGFQRHIPPAVPPAVDPQLLDLHGVVEHRRAHRPEVHQRKHVSGNAAPNPIVRALKSNSSFSKSSANDATSVCSRNVGRIQSARCFTRTTNTGAPDTTRGGPSAADGSATRHAEAQLRERERNNRRRQRGRRKLASKFPSFEASPTNERRPASDVAFVASFPRERDVAEHPPRDAVLLQAVDLVRCPRARCAERPPRANSPTPHRRRSPW